MKMRLTLLQKELIAWVLLFAVCGGAGIYYINHLPNEHPGMIRLHVIANSDSKEDQELKLKVRDEILKLMEGQENIQDARSYINDNIDMFRSTIHNALLMEQLQAVMDEMTVEYSPEYDLVTTTTLY